MAEWFRALKRRYRLARALRELAGRRCETPLPHRLSGPLVVSLTSYPGRYATLHLTLRCLLRQSMTPDRVILWIAEADLALLPSSVRALEAEGLEIRATADLGSYKKIVPALAAFPEAWIATADDDMYYGPDWLADLVRPARPGLVVAHRAHRLVWEGTALAPYGRWTKNISGAVEGPEIFATGAGGVLYPPSSLHEETTQAALFTRLCPGADDIWLYWMARRAGSVVRHVGPPVRILEWPGSQLQSLRAQNHGADAGNDRALAAMAAQYGWPTR